MHTTTIRNVRIQHNGDWSGDVIVSWVDDGKPGEVKIPGWVARTIAGLGNTAAKDIVDDLRELVRRYG